MKRSLLCVLVICVAACLEPPALAPDMATTPDLPDAMFPDAPTDMPQDASEDMPEDVQDVDLPEEMTLDETPDQSEGPCTLGVVECQAMVRRRVCGPDGTWFELEPCSTICAGAGECLPSTSLGDLDELRRYPMPASMNSSPAWNTSVLLADGGVFGGWQFQAGEEHFREGTIHTHAGSFVETLSWTPSWHADKDPASWGGNCAEFGRSLAVSQDGLLLAVGAPGLSLDEEIQPSLSMMTGQLFCGAETSDKDGAVYLFTRAPNSTTWNHVRTLTQADVDGESDQKGTLFGLALEMSPSGDRLFVGAPLANKPRGLVYVFDVRRAFDASPMIAYRSRIHEMNVGTEEFGASLSLGTDLLAIGARDSQRLEAEGFGAVFIASATALDDELADALKTPVNVTNMAAQKRVRLGQTVSISQDDTRVVASAPGAVYVRGGTSYQGRVITWSTAEDLTLVEPSATDVPDTLMSSGSAFGSMVTLSRDGSRLLVGAPNEGEAVFPGQMFPRRGEARLMGWDGTLQWDVYWPVGQNSPFEERYVNRGSFGAGSSRTTPAGRVIVSSGDETHTNGTGVFYEFVMSSD